MSSASANRAVVLLSGGLDSATCLAIACQQGFQIYALSFDYGQRHQVELEAAGRIAERCPVVEHLTMCIDMRQIGGSALLPGGGDALQVSKNRKFAQISQSIPTTYVPARNTIFLSFALAWAEVLSVRDIFIGVNAVDYSGYPDCRPEFIVAFERMANKATRAGVEGSTVKIHTPLIHMSKAEIINKGTALGVDYGLTVSCYDPSAAGRPCGECDACILRHKGFVEAGVSDPAL